MYALSGASGESLTLETGLAANFRFGSPADLFTDNSATAASGGKAAPRVEYFQNPKLSVCFHRERTFGSLQILEIEGQQTSNCGRSNRSNSTKFKARFRPRVTSQSTPSR